VDQQLQTLIDLQGLDSRIAGLETELARLPVQIEEIRASVAQTRKAVEDLKGKLDSTKKEIRSKEQDLEVTASKRTKCEARLYEVKTNKEYSAVLSEIEGIKQEKAKIEEEILALMESQERLATEIREAEARLAKHEAEGRAEEATMKARLEAAETDLALVRGDRESLARQLQRDLLASYERLLTRPGNLAVAQVLPGGICGGCRVTLTPQRLQEVKQQSALHNCESCGRYQYWLPA
jgi:predicted  nucleic acid-binding Zn-ribbon protein